MANLTRSEIENINVALSNRLSQHEISELIRNPVLRGSALLEQLTKAEQDKTDQIYKERQFFNMSLKQLGEKMSTSYIKIMNDLLEFKADGETTTENINSVTNIFFREDRLLYLGMSLILLALIFTLISSI